MARAVVVIVASSLALAGPAAAEVRLHHELLLDRFAERGAVGLYVTDRDRPSGTAIELRLLGQPGTKITPLPPRAGVPGPGPLRIRIGAPGPPYVHLQLPAAGEEEPGRYPIAVVGDGFRGVLTSRSTRIDGLVTLGDVLDGRLEWRADDGAVAMVERLDDRIERNDAVRLPLEVLIAAVVLMLAFVRPGLAVRAVLLALALNLWLSPALAVAAALAAVALPLGPACAVVIGVYLAALGLDGESVALSPLGPSQVGRFYGINNLLETLLLVPALVGVALLGRLGVLVAALALVTVAGTPFGADGGGLLVLLAGYAVLAWRLAGPRLTVRRGLGIGAAIAAAGAALVAIDVLTGGTSHVTDAIGGGPGELLGDAGDRLSYAVERTADSPGALVVVVAGLGVLAWAALRRAGPLPDALVAALAVSFLVNDTPSDVAGLGAAAAFALVRFSEARRDGTLVGSAPMRRASALLLVFLALALAGVAAGCGGGEEASPVPETVEGTVPQETEEEGGNGGGEGDPAAGKEVFASAGCGSCHVLADANASGTVGPNLDDAQPDHDLVVERVTNGMGAMPSFRDQLSEEQIQNVAAYVVQATSG